MRPLPLVPAALVLAAAALAVPTAAQGSVWNVAPEPGPGVDATQISDAVDLASDGDLILVQNGAYDPFTIDGKSLTIQGGVVMPEFDDPLHPTPLTIENLAPHQTVTIRGMLVFHFGDLGPAGVLRNAAANVLFEDVFFDFLGGAKGLEITDCASVTLSECVVQVGGLTAVSGATAADQPALDVLRSDVFVYATDLRGAIGHSELVREAGSLPPSDGAPGARLRASALTAAGSTIRGGAGGSSFLNCHGAGDGGAGIVVDADLGVPSSVRLQDTPVDGGSGGSTAFGCGLPNGSNGQDLAIVAGSVSVLPGIARSLQLTSPSEAGTTVEAKAQGIVGDVLFLVASTDLLPGVFLPGPDVTLHAFPDIVIPIGSLSTPTQSFTLPTPGVPAPLEFAAVNAQGLFLAINGDVELSGPTRTVVLGG